MTIEGTITLDDESTSQFAIDEEGNWHQWGANERRLGETVGIVDGIAATARLADLA